MCGPVASPLFLAGRSLAGRSRRCAQPCKWGCTPPLASSLPPLKSDHVVLTWMLLPGIHALRYAATLGPSFGSAEWFAVGESSGDGTLNPLAAHRSLLHGSFLARSADRTLSLLTSCSLDARLRCPVGLRGGAGTDGGFFPLAAFECLLAAGQHACPSSLRHPASAPRAASMPPTGVIRGRPCPRVGYRQLSVYPLSLSADR